MIKNVIPFNDPQEKIFRAVRPNNKLYWDSNGKVTSAVFDLRKNEKGLSFDRAYRREDQICCKTMHKRLSGTIISLRVGCCLILEKIQLQHTPSDYNLYHTELLYLTVDQKKLKQIKHQLAILSQNETF